MNGGYVIAESKVTDEFLRHVIGKEASFTVTGLYSKLSELYKTRKNVIVSTKDGDDHMITYGSIVYDDFSEIYIVTSFASFLVAAVSVSKDDTCAGKYISIQ